MELNEKAEKDGLGIWCAAQRIALGRRTWVYGMYEENNPKSIKFPFNWEWV